MATQYETVVAAVQTADQPVDAATVAELAGAPVSSARVHLARATKRGALVRAGRGHYTAREFVVSGDTDLPVGARDREWDGDAAQDRVFDLCTTDDGVDAACVGRAFLWRDPDADPETRAAYSLGFADVIDGDLTIIPEGVFAAAQRVDQTDVSEEDRDEIKARICSLYDTMAEAFEDDPPVCPFADDEDGAVTAAAGEQIPVEGPVVIEGTATGDGRMIDTGALAWGEGPWPIIWDRQDGDHTGQTVGVVADLERRGDVIWATGHLSASDDPETAAAVARVAELFDEGAVGVSVALDSEAVELRIPRHLLEDVETPEPDELDELDESEDGRVVVARFRHDDMLEVVTEARVRHVAVVDTPAFAEAELALVASAAVADPSWFDDPLFGAPHDDDRLRFDPIRKLWSAPFTVTDDGRIFGHLNPSGVCLVGAPGCKLPPDGLGAFMRYAAPAAAGKRTGPIVLGTPHAHSKLGIAEANAYLADTGRAVADACVGRDRYGAWVAGSVRPGVSEADLYTLRSSGISGEWRPVNGRHELSAIVTVSSEGFPKGYMTSAEVMAQGLVASAAAPACDVCGDDCGCDNELQDRIKTLETVVAELYAAHTLTTIGD